MMINSTKTIYVLFANKKERDRMAEFCQGRDWAKWSATEISPVLGPPAGGEDLGLGVALGRRALGFEGEDLPQWAWALMAWMATQSSHRVNFWPVVHWGEEEFPVWARSPQDNRVHDYDRLVVGEDGLLRSWRARNLPMGPDDQAQKALLTKMSQDWISYLGRQKTGGQKKNNVRAA